MNTNLLCDDLVIIDGEAFFASKDENALYKFNLQSEEVDYLGRFPENNFSTVRLFHSVISTGNKLFFFPCEANCIFAYDIRENKYERIEIELKFIDRYYWHLPSKTYFWKAVLHNGYIYAAGMGYPGIVKVDILTYEITVLDGWVRSIEQKVYAWSDEVYIQDAIIDGNYILFPLCCLGGILQLDTVTQKIELINVSENVNGFAGILQWKDKYVLIPRKQSDVVIWDPKSKGTINIKIPYKKNKENEKLVPFQSWIILNDKLHLSRVFSEDNYIIDLSRRALSDDGLFPLERKRISFAKMLEQNCLLYIDTDTREWIIYDLVNQINKKTFVVRKNKTDIAKWFKLELEDENAPIIENSKKGLDGFISYICTEERDK